MKATLAAGIAAAHVLLLFTTAAASSLRAPFKKSQALVVEHKELSEDKLNPRKAKQQYARVKHRQRVHMLAHEIRADEEAMKGCTACDGVQIVYGKYQSEDGDATDNSYYLFTDPKKAKESETGYPVLVHFHHGGFFSGAPWKKENEEVNAYLKQGFAVVSVGYRSVTQKYFYKAEDGANSTEELIQVSDEGRLSLDTTGKTMADYKVRVGKQEFITKCLYDAAAAIDHLVANADKFGLDIHRIVFAGQSTGGAMMQYLSWVYHKWNAEKYTPRGIVYENGQLDYPVYNMMDKTWGIFADTLGPKTKLSDIMSVEACPEIVGNHMCGSPLGEASDYELCNHALNQEVVGRYCGAAFTTVTLADLQLSQTYPEDDGGLSKGAREALWYNSENIQKHLPYDPFYVYVANSLNGTRAVDVAHHSIFAMNFAKYAEMNKKGGIQYTVYYSDFKHMTEEDHGMKRFGTRQVDAGFDLAMPAAATAALGAIAAGPGPAPAAMFAPAPGPAPAPAPARPPSSTIAYNYLSTHGWREDFTSRETKVGSRDERVLYACLAAGAGPFRTFEVEENKTAVNKTKESGAEMVFAPSIVTAFFTSLALLLSF